MLSEMRRPSRSRKDPSPSPPIRLPSILFEFSYSSLVFTCTFGGREKQHGAKFLVQGNEINGRQSSSYPPSVQKSDALTANKNKTKKVTARATCIENCCRHEKALSTTSKRTPYLGGLDFLVIDKVWTVKTVHLEINRLGVNKHLKKKTQTKQLLLSKRKETKLNQMTNKPESRTQRRKLLTDYSSLVKNINVKRKSASERAERDLGLHRLLLLFLSLNNRVQNLQFSVRHKMLCDLIKHGNASSTHLSIILGPKLELRCLGIHRNSS